MHARRLLKIFAFLVLLPWIFSIRAAEGQIVQRMGYSGSGIGADDLIRVMMKEKIWPKYGIDVRPIYFNSGTLLAQALLGGEIHSSESDVPTVLNLGVSGLLDVKLVAVTINRIEHSLVVRNEINTPADLIGKKLAISRFGAASISRLGLQCDFGNSIQIKM